MQKLAMVFEKMSDDCGGCLHLIDARFSPVIFSYLVDIKESRGISLPKNHFTKVAFRLSNCSYVNKEADNGT